jgi:uncharacterized membrane protein YhaH (DUF805 family)
MLWLAGRARRREYWLWVVPLLVLQMGLGAFGAVAMGFIFGWAMLLVWIRRLHDLGHSGWWAPVINVFVNVGFGVLSIAFGDIGTLLGFLLFLGVIVTLGSIPGERGTNEFGPSPNGQTEADAAA